MLSNHADTMFSHIDILDDEFNLADGIQMQIKYSLPASASSLLLPTLIFLHGSFHSAWCWAEYFMPYFASIGYPCVALSLRGTSGSGGTYAGNKVKIDEHVNDVLYFLEYLRKRILERDSNGKYDDTMRLYFDYISKKAAKSTTVIAPIVISHSFGSLTAMKLLECLPKKDTINSQPLLSSMATFCPVPPSGMSKMSLRALRRNPMRGWNIMKGLAMKKASSDPKMCRLLFFDQGLSDKKLNKYMKHFDEDSKVTVDVHDLAKKLPRLAADKDGCSTDVRNGVLQYKALVVGAQNDYIVDQEAVKETAKFMGVSNDPIVVEGAVHDVMLADCWGNVAKELEIWLNDILKMAETSPPSQ